MFRITLRELFLFTTCAALGTGWWLDHRLKVEAAEDARSLAHFSAWRFGMCGNEASCFADLQKKYGAQPAMITPRIIITSEEEEKLGIDFEEP